MLTRENPYYPSHAQVSTQRTQNNTKSLNSTSMVERIEETQENFQNNQSKKYNQGTFSNKKVVRRES